MGIWLGLACANTCSLPYPSHPISIRHHLIPPSLPLSGTTTFSPLPSPGHAPSGVGPLPPLWIYLPAYVLPVYLITPPRPISIRHHLMLSTLEAFAVESTFKKWMNLVGRLRPDW